MKRRALAKEIGGRRRTTTFIVTFQNHNDFAELKVVGSDALGEEVVVVRGENLLNSVR